MNAKRWMALFLALTLAITMLAGCTKKTETPVADPEQGQMEPEPGQETQNQTQPVTPQQPEQEEKPQPEEPTPNEPQDEQQPVQEPELTPEQKRRRTIETRVAEATVWARDEEYDNPFTEEAVRTYLTSFLFDRWDDPQTPVCAYFEADDFRLNLYQNTLDEYFCVLSHTDTLDELTIRVDKNGAQMITPSAAVADPPKISEAVSSLVDGAKFDKRYDGYYFDDKMDAEKNRVFRAYAAQALHAFEQTIEKNKDDWKAVLDDAFRTSVSFNENDQFVFELQGKSTYWLELRYRPECGVWSDVSLVPTFTDGQADWKPDEGKLTDDYLLSLVTSLELGMTAAPFTFDRPKDLTQQQLWLMFLLLMPKAELEATYDKQDGMYHITQKMMENTLISYLEYFRFDITKNPGYSETLGEIVVPTVSGFGGGMLAKLREKHVDGSTVTFTVDYYAGDDVGFTAPEYAKTYTLTFFYGRYRYESAVEAA